MPSLKEQLYQYCMDFVTKRETEIKKVIADAQDAKNNETKSSAGDKYETSREVMQQEINLNLARLADLGTLRATLEHITPAQQGATAQPGSVVYTSNGNFYIAIGAGKIIVDGVTFFSISATSPIGSKLLGREAGYSFELNGKKFVIERID